MSERKKTQGHHVVFLAFAGCDPEAFLLPEGELDRDVCLWLAGNGSFKREDLTRCFPSDPETCSKLVADKWKTTYQRWVDKGNKLKDQYSSLDVPVTVSSVMMAALPARPVSG